MTQSGTPSSEYTCSKCGQPVEWGLTSREREILALYAEGKRIAEVAKELGISVRTVGNHNSNIFSKLGVNNRVSAVLAYIRSNKEAA